MIREYDENNTSEEFKMITDTGDKTFVEMNSLLLIGLKNEIKNLQEYIDTVQISESIPESDKKMMILSTFHDAVEVSKLINLAAIATKLALLSSIKNGDLSLTIPLSSCVDLIGSVNSLAVSKIKID